MLLACGNLCAFLSSEAALATGKAAACSVRARRDLWGFSLGTGSVLWLLPFGTLFSVFAFCSFGSHFFLIPTSYPPFLSSTAVLIFLGDVRFPLGVRFRYRFGVAGRLDFSWIERQDLGFSPESRFGHGDPP